MVDEDPVSRQAILDAALTELVNRGIDDFRLENVAELAGVQPAAIRRIWGDRRALLLDALISTASEYVPPPDTGSLRADLEAVLVASAKVAETNRGRRWLHRMLAASGDADLSEVRTDFWRVRHNEMVKILRRAESRGELREDIDVDEAIRMFSGASLLDIVVADTPMRPGYLIQLLDIFIRGISKAP